MSGDFLFVTMVGIFVLWLIAWAIANTSHRS